MTASTVVNDAPISLPGKGPNGSVWTPKNSDGRYSGYITLRQALTASKNMVSIRILMSIGVGYAQQYIRRFGFRSSELLSKPVYGFRYGRDNAVESGGGI